MNDEIHVDGVPEPRSTLPVEDSWGLTLAGRRYSWRQLGAVVFLALGGAVVLTGYVGVSRNTEVWEQMPYVISGGVGGLALILVGLALYNAHQHVAGRQVAHDLARRLEALELGLGGEFDEVLRRLEDLATPQRSSQARR